MSEAAAPFVAPAQPLLSTDASGFVLMALAVLYLALWWRDREPGMQWIGVCFWLTGLWWATFRQHPTTGMHVGSPFWAMLLPVGLMSMAAGLVQYLQVPTHLRRRLLALLWALPFAALVLSGLALIMPVPRTWVSLTVTLGLVGLAGLSIWSARREPGAGHGYVGVALLSVPLSSMGALALGVDVILVAYSAALPLIFFGLVLLTVSLLRRRLALEAEVRRRAEAEASLAALNDSLEQQVAMRTADLQDMVAGLESFNRSVSHDLRGPLGGMASLARMAEDGLARGDLSVAQRMLPAIRRQSESSEKLVAALLELARVGDAQMQRQAVDLQALAQEVSESLRALQGAAAQVDVVALPTVDADPELLRAVFTNLIGNGLKFCAERTDGRVVVGSREEAGAVIVEVADNGAGFDEAGAATLFKPFQRLHGTRYEGHGVGLSIVRRAVERHGGRVWAQGQPGAGATFSFSLPRTA